MDHRNSSLRGSTKSSALHPGSIKPRSERMTRRYHMKKLQNPETKAVFVAELRSNLAMTQQTHADIDDQWNHVKSAFLRARDNILKTVLFYAEKESNGPLLHRSYQHSPYHRRASKRISAKFAPDFRGLREGLRHVKTRQHNMAGDGKERDTNEVRQGCILSPLLFLIVLDEVLTVLV
ncbi:hypothetical protein ILUMI_17316 [Ignelater luminosus]|uniref:Uncharacterized protein n=1 Tax=Ignelater luminosus TaxID=2038154 RepID=A0A8K0CPA7_IGNLU|nr:hypothetical protein ILUMI_17316 [Ignelater luminosus]